MKKRLAGTWTTKALWAAAALAATEGTSRAVLTHEWTGADDGVWTTAANWINPPPTTDFDRLFFNTSSSLASQLGGAFSGRLLEFGPDSGNSLVGHTISAAGPGDLLTLSGGIDTAAPGTQVLNVPVTFSNAAQGGSGIVEITNRSGINSGTPNSLRFQGPVTIAAGTTLRINDIAGFSLQTNFTGGISGVGSLEIGTAPFAGQTSVGLFGDNTFTGNLRVQSNVTVYDHPVGAGQLSGVTNIYIGGPIDFQPNRATLQMGATAGGPPPAVFPNRINDSAIITLQNGTLELLRPATGGSTPPNEEVVGEVHFQFGHSGLEINGVDAGEPNYLRMTKLVRDSAGATGTLHATLSDAITLGEDPSFAGDTNYIVDNVAASSLSTIGGTGNPTNGTATNVAIVPWLTGANRDGVAKTFLNFASGTRFTPLADSQYASSLSAAGATDNVSLHHETLAADATVNALRIAGPDDTGASTLDLGGHTLEITSGALLVRGDGSFTRSIAEGTLHFGQQGIIVNESSSTVISADITGANGLVLSGNEALTLSGNNSYSGETWLNQIVNVTSSTAFGSAADGTHLNQDVALVFLPSGSGPLAVAESFFEFNGSKGNLLAINTGVTLAGELRSNLPTGSPMAELHLATAYDSGNNTSITVNGNITAAGTTTWFLDAQGEFSQYGGSRIAFNGAIQDAPGGTVSVVAQGNGDKILTRNNTYSGETRVTAGRLVVSNSNTVSGSATGTGPVRLYGGGSLMTALAGDGRLAGPVEIHGALVAPATDLGAPAQLTFGNELTFSALDTTNSVAQFDLLSGGEFDSWRFNGATQGLHLDNAVTLQINLLNDLPEGTTFRLVSSSEALLPITGYFLAGETPAGVDDLFTFDVNTAFGLRTFQLDYGANYVDLTLVPEPGTAVLLLAGAASLGLRRRAVRRA